MTRQNETRRAGGAAGLDKLSFPGEDDDPENKTSNHRIQAKTAVIDAARQFRTQAQRGTAARLRRQRHVEFLHRLGPAPLGHFIREVEVATRADVTAVLERYAEVDPEFVRALGGDRFPPPLLCIDGGRP